METVSTVFKEVMELMEVNLFKVELFKRSAALTKRY